MAKPSKGFEISFDSSRQILKARVWGEWDAEFAKKYHHAITERIKEISAGRAQWNFLIDVTALRAQSADVQNILKDHLASAPKWGLKKLAHFGHTSKTRRPSRITLPVATIREAAFFESEEDAVQWLVNGSPEEER